MSHAALDPIVEALARAPSERSYQRQAAHIAALIAEGEFGVGERLPSERALAEGFQVSRRSVREAIVALEVRGWAGVLLETVTALWNRTANPLSEQGVHPWQIDWSARPRS